MTNTHAQAMAAAEVVLDGTALDAQVTPEELAALVQVSGACRVVVCVGRVRRSVVAAFTAHAAAVPQSKPRPSPG